MLLELAGNLISGTGSGPMSPPADPGPHIVAIGENRTAIVRQYRTRSAADKALPRLVDELKAIGPEHWSLKYGLDATDS